MKNYTLYRSLSSGRLLLVHSEGSCILLHDGGTSRHNTLFTKNVWMDWNKRDFTKIGCIIKMGNKDKLSAKRLDKLSAKRLDHSNIIKIVINNNNEYFITEDGILEYVHVQRFYENYNRLRDIPTWRELDKLVFRECEKKNHPWLKGL